MAIAVDATSQGQSVAGSTSYTLSHTCSGSDRILWVQVGNSTANDTITGVTYGGTAMTLVKKAGGSSSGKYWNYLYYLVAPATGANNIVASASSGSYIIVRGVSYTGASQTGVPDSSPDATTNSTTTSDTLSTTTVADNCWILMAVAGQRAISASTGSNYRIGDANTQWQIFDTNGAKSPAGSYSMSVTYAAAVWEVCIMASFAPSGAAAPTFVPKIIMY